MNDTPEIRTEIVAHPQGGFTLAVPVGGDSTVRIYQGITPLRPKRKKKKRHTR